MHKLDFYSILKFIAFLWNLLPTSYRSFPHPLAPNKMSEINQEIETLKHG